MGEDGMLKLGLSDPDETPESTNADREVNIAYLFVAILLILPVGWMLAGNSIQKEVAAEAAEASRKSAAETKAQQQRFQSIDAIGKLNKKIATEGGSYAGMVGVTMSDSDAHDKFIVGITRDGMLAVSQPATRIQFFSSLTETFQEVSGEKGVQVYLYYGTQHICTLIGDAVLGSYIEGWGCD